MDKKDIYKTWEYLGHSPVEIRVIRPERGVLEDRLVLSELELIQTCEKWDGKGNIYAGLNERRKDLVVGREGAKKADIVAVWTIPIDIDAIRQSDEPITSDERKKLQKQPSTDKELECAIEAGQAIQMWFREKRFYVPPMAMSGNGVALWRAIPRYELKSDDARETWEQKLRAFLKEVAGAIPDELGDKVKIDTNVYDVTRILKVIGTTSVKGTPTPERPHRVSHWMDNPMRIEDAGLLDYILSIDISPSKPQKAVATHHVRPKSTQTIISLPELSDTHKNILKMAIRHPYVVLAKRRMNYRDLSESDWAFLCELRKEGITDRDMLIYALATCKDTKYQRDYQANYIQRTVDNFLARLEGMSLQKGREKLGHEMRQLTFERKEIGNKTRILFIGAGIGLGKTFNAQNLVARAREAGEKVLVVIPLHMLGDEWFQQLQVEYGIHDVIQLYGVTHEKVKCPFVEKAGWLLSLGHSQLFKQRYCGGLCKGRNDCLHLKSLEWAKTASVLIATHSHSNVHQSFFKLRSLDNDVRSLIIVDEIPQLVNPVRLKRDTLKVNLELFKILGKSNTDVPFNKFIELVIGLLNALLARKNYQYPETLSGGIAQEQVARADYLIARYHIEQKVKPKRNLIWDLGHLLNTLTPVKYDISEDAMIYRWRPEFRSHQNVIIMSGTTKSQYIEKQLRRQVETIGEDWHIRRENVKIIQMLNVTGGRNRLIRDSEKDNLQAHIREFFDLALCKHANQRIVIICSLGASAPESETKGSAKGRIIRMLFPIADKHGRKLVAVSTNDLQNGNIPDGLTEIPVLHWGILGIDTLKGKFDVIIETNAHYFHPDSILQSTYEKFDHDTSEVEPIRVKTKFHAVDKTFDLYQWIYPDELVRLEVDQTERASIEQTEGRFLREDDIHKTIYRLHNVNIQPYPHRVYKSWDALFEYEFYPFVPTEILTNNLTGRDEDVWTWICENAQGKNFTVNQVSQGTGIAESAIKNRYLSKLLSLGLIKVIQQGGPGRENETIYRTNPDVARI